jgi:hypothetical protein
VGLLELQKKDSDISLVRQWLEQVQRPAYKDIASAGVALKTLWSQWDQLLLEKGMVYRKWSITGTTETQLQAIVPRTERRTVLQQYHDSETAGHLGVRKTLSKIRQKYYWPGLRMDVRLYIAGCERCAKRKKPTKNRRAPMQVQECGIPMERLATDVLGPLPETDEGNRYILVVGNYYTKWTESFAMANMEAQTVAKIIVEQVICRLGVPVTLHSDQGRQFESKLFAEMCQLLRIYKTRTPPYNPQSDGMIERFNKALVTMLSMFVSEYHTDWDKYLPYVMMAYRAVEHETTGCTPNRMMLGRDTGTPLDLMYELPSGMKKIPATLWAWELQERLEVAHWFVQKHIKGKMQRQKMYHDKKLSWENFNPGDLVYVFFPQRKEGRSPKLTSFWRGPYTVKSCRSDVTCMVNCGPRGQDQVIHIDRMRLRKPQVINDEDVPREQLESEESDLANLEDLEETAGMADPDNEENGRRPRRACRPPAWMGVYWV